MFVGWLVGRRFIWMEIAEFGKKSQIYLFLNKYLLRKRYLSGDTFNSETTRRINLKLCMMMQTSVKSFQIWGFFGTYPTSQSHLAIFLARLEAPDNIFSNPNDENKFITVSMKQFFSVSEFQAGKHTTKYSYKLQ